MVCKFADENPSGEVSLPLVQNLSLITSLRSIVRVKNQTLIENFARLIKDWVFIFPTLFKIFGYLCLSLIDNTKVRKLFDITKCFQDYFTKNLYSFSLS